VYSEPGEGTTFKIYLPKTGSRADHSQDSTQDSRTILVIEDDDMIRTLTVTALRQQGHQVWEAQDGSQALELCENRNESLDLVITDIGAPGMSGEDLMGYFAVKYPNVAILHMSGFSHRFLRDTNVVGVNSCFLAKPFTVQQLLEKVQEALTQGQGSTLD
jgi:DNA-binding NtrC family response regulator